jgi:putative SOS response-associated peptidase YedK
MQGTKQRGLSIPGGKPLVYGEKEGLTICGRYLISTEEEIIEVREIMDEINRRYLGKPEYASMKSGEIFPADIVPVIALKNKQPQVNLFKWGFPHWKGAGVIINARSETVFEKNMFREAFANRRCVIPATGFYEWQKDSSKKKKDKYLLKQSDTPMLYMAGIYAVYGNLPGFVILTIAANPSVQPIHNRMPVIIKKQEQEVWLKDEDFARRIITREGPHLDVWAL